MAPSFTAKDLHDLEDLKRLIRDELIRADLFHNEPEWSDRLINDTLRMLFGQPQRMFDSADATTRHSYDRSDARRMRIICESARDLFGEHINHDLADRLLADITAHEKEWDEFVVINARA